MLPRIQNVRHVRDFRIWLRFADGLEGEIDLEPELQGEVFEPLRDPQMFARLRMDPELNTVVWPTGADFAPEFLYQRVRSAPGSSPRRAA